MTCRVLRCRQETGYFFFQVSFHVTMRMPIRARTHAYDACWCWCDVGVVSGGVILEVGVVFGDTGGLVDSGGVVGVLCCF